jgi:predicted alpha/beta hydrolase
VDHRHVIPREVGAPAIGHFGFFRERFRDTLWRESAGWLGRQAA